MQSRPIQYGNFSLGREVGGGGGGGGGGGVRGRCPEEVKRTIFR